MGRRRRGCPRPRPATTDQRPSCLAETPASDVLGPATAVRTRRRRGVADLPRRARPLDQNVAGRRFTQRGPESLGDCGAVHSFQVSVPTPVFVSGGKSPVVVAGRITQDLCEDNP